jgi:glycosyltransferase involved in cell wall biosynthesis
VSVIIPTRNRRDKLEQAVYSVLSQGVRNLELLIVDDACTDATPQFLDRLACDPRVRTLRNPDPLGACESRNKALETAQGELVAFCDDDDIWLPGAATTLMQHLADNPDMAAVSSWHLVAHDTTGQVAVFRGPTEFDAQQLEWQNFGIVFGMFRRAALPEPLQFDARLVTGEDWDLWLRSARARRVGAVPRVLYVYRRHGRDQTTAGITRQTQGRRAFLEKHYATMSSSCRLYHEALIAGYEEGRSAVGRKLLKIGRDSPRDAAFASFVLGASYVSSHVGTRLGDPGLQARTMAASVKHDPSARTRRSLRAASNAADVR